MECEPRKNIRVQVDIQGEVHLGERTFPVLMPNLSVGGCLIETSSRPRMREILTLKVRRGMSMEEFNLKVAYQPYGQGLGEIGTQFHSREEGEVREMLGRILTLASEPL